MSKSIPYESTLPLACREIFATRDVAKQSIDGVTRRGMHLASTTPFIWFHDQVYTRTGQMFESMIRTIKQNCVLSLL